LSDSETTKWPWILPVALIAAALLRVPGLFTEMWMDEILSVRLTQALRSPLGVFVQLHTDNNHYLNSLWMWSVGVHAPGWLMRLPPLLLGVALVALAYRIALPRGRGVAAVTVALFALSYPLIHYSSEARGYGYLVFFALLAYGLFRSWVGERTWRTGAAYAAAAALALLAHLGFVTVFAAFLIWSLLEVVGAKENRARIGWSHAAAHAVPALTLLAIYLADIRFMTAEGGFARLRPLESLTGAAGLVVGDAPGVMAAAIAAVAWAAIALAVRRSYFESRNETAFLVAAIGLSLISGALPGYGYPRYYLTALLFSLLLLGRSIGTATASGTWKVAGIALLVLVGAVNLGQTLQFASVGRGMYREAAAYMAAAAGTGRVTVAGSHDMGSILALDYYAADLPRPTRFTYYCHAEATTSECTRVRPSRSRGEAPPEFYILSSLDDRFVPPNALDVPDVAEYRFMRSFPKYGLSGVYWAVYGIPDRPPVP
jgi:hypothetical protein